MLHRVTHYLTSYVMPLVIFILLAFIMRQYALSTGHYVPKQPPYFHVYINK